MIVADTSALGAVVFGEAEAMLFREIMSLERLLVSAVSSVELIAVAAARGAEWKSAADEILSNPSIRIVPVDLEQGRLARDAYLQFGKGRHPAGLNLGDVFPYALAKQRGLPLLFKGDDFARTDVTVAAV